MSDDREWELNDSEDHDVTTDESQSVTDPEVHQDKTDTDESGKKKGGREHYCSMCLRPESVAGHLMEIPGMGGQPVYVCEDCMQKSFDMVKNTNFNDILNNYRNMGMRFNGADAVGHNRAEEADKGGKKKPEKKKLTLKDIPAPHIIRKKLDEYVIGQDHAKKVMSVGVYNHYKRILSEDKDDDGVEIEKSNMLMIGPTGSGKTYLVKTLAKMLDVPLAITDATSLTEAGYIGDDIESVVSKLLAAADNDVARCETGIIFIDEIDKINKKKNTNQRDVSGEAVQQGLLKLLEGSEVEVPVGATSKNAMVPLQTVNTKNILFICGGAFPDLEDIIRERLRKTSSMGFQAQLKDEGKDDKNILQKVTMEDLRAFGMIPEFLGRLPIVFALDAMDEDMLVRIMKEPKNSIIRQYQKLLAIDNVKLVFEDDALHVIAKEALEKDTGARALRAIIEDFMLDIMYEIPKDPNIGEVVITKAYVEHTGGPGIFMRGQPVPELPDGSAVNV
ncbi:MAG: ATP-dependent Clp protease ATP-binding subunit ClpX [Bilifractor sp.]|jgi:ATP-dependent Clp protease ATP-binding subunit ClpX